MYIHLELKIDCKQHPEIVAMRNSTSEKYRNTCTMKCNQTESEVDNRDVDMLRKAPKDRLQAVNNSIFDIEKQTEFNRMQIPVLPL